MTRRPDWQARFFAVLASYESEPFVWGKSDCACLAADCISAITDADFLGTYRGQYTSRLTAAGRINGRRHKSMHDAVQAEMQRIQAPSVPPDFARVGDVGLGICGTLCVRTPAGFVARNGDGRFAFVITLQAAWRIG